MDRQDRQDGGVEGCAHILTILNRKDDEVEGCAYLLVRTLKLVDEQSSIGECWISPKKDMPCPRASKSPSKKVGGVK